jgi:uncharacterized protein (UPF0332 family)
VDVEEFVRKGYLERTAKDEKLVKKEFDEADYDLARAKDALKEGDFKWCIIKAYYSMFHAAKALMFALGFREKRHFIIGVFLEQLSMEGKLQSSFVNDFRGAMLAREDADYRYVHTKDTSEYLVEVAQEFVTKMKDIPGKAKTK